MLSYCLKFKKNPKVIKTKNGRIMLLSKCTVCNSKKTKFIKEKETSGILSNLTGITVPTLSDLPIAIFCFKSMKCIQ